MKHFLIIICVLFAIQVQAAEPLKVTSEIKQATVYLKGAMLKNKATASVPSGQSTVLFTGLSYNILRESIRIKPEGCQILSVTMKKNFLDLEQLDAELKKMKEELTNLQEKRRDDNENLAVYAQEKDMILANKNIGGKQNGVDPEKLKATADFFRQRLSDILSKEQAIKLDMAKSDKRMSELAAQINQSAAKNIYPTSEIEVNISSEKATTAQFEIEYYITEAGWFPAYDFRVTNLTSPMQIDYVAHIYQNSGIEWKNVDISVSSADPGNNGGIPIPKTWYVSQNNYRLQYDIQKPQTELNKVSGRVIDVNGRPIAYANVAIENSSVGGGTDYEGRFSIALPAGAQNINISAVGFDKQTRVITQGEMIIYLQAPARDYDMKNKITGGANGREGKLSLRGSRGDSLIFIDGVKVRGQAGIPMSGSVITESNVNTTTSAVSFEYALKEKMSIPSDGRPYTAPIMKREIAAEYKHFAAPKITRDAYLNVFIPEWEKLNLLEGEVNLYFGNSYTGKSVVSLRDLKDSLEFSMGKDPNIKIQRTLTFQKTTGGGILPNKNSAYRWASEIRNTGTMPVRLTVTEPFPVSTEKEIKVELDKEVSNATIDKEKGLLTWEITLQPGEQKKLEFGFNVTYPKGLNMRFE